MSRSTSISCSRLTLSPVHGKKAGLLSRIECEIHPAKLLRMDKCMLTVDLGVNRSPGNTQTTGQRPVGGICELVTGAQEAMSQLQLLVASDHDQLLQIASCPNDCPRHVAQRMKSLRALLEDGHLKGGSTFTPKDKRILGVILAHSLLQLCEGPWVSDKLDNRSVFFLLQP
jgi:hypothetical protein